MFQKIKQNAKIVAGAAAGVLAAAPSFAVGVADYSGLSTSVTTELSSALTVAVPLAGTLLAVGIGWKFIKRFTK